MTMSVDIPADVQPFLQQAIAHGAYADEQEAVAAILRVAAGSLESYQKIQSSVQRSLEDEQAGRVREADFNGLRQQITDTTKS